MMSSDAEPTYSQSGEDRILHALFSFFSDRTALRYYDIGASLPIGHNNSYLAYCMGGEGVLVEADPAYAPDYPVVRPRDTHVSAAVVPQRLRAGGTITFHILADRGWSTASDEHLAIAAVLGKGAPDRTIVVPCLTINELLESHPIGRDLDFISLDIEGFDKEVLAELDTERFDPKAIVAENSGGMPVHKDIMEAKGYEMYAFTFINSVYIKRRHFKL